jgi:hypothetical protein
LKVFSIGTVYLNDNFPTSNLSIPAADDGRCSTCHNPESSITIDHMALCRQIENGCRTCALIHNGLMNFKDKRERVTGPNLKRVSYEIEISAENPSRVTTEIVLDSAEQAMDPPIHEFLTLPGTVFGKLP